MSFLLLRQFAFVCLFVSLAFQAGCATWLPAGDEPAAASSKVGFGTAVASRGAAGIETILVRLNQAQAVRLPELWGQIDEQALTPELRFAMDKNGMRAGKISGNSPPLLDEWVRQTVQRIGEDPMEQAGFAADVTSFSQLWRCRDNVRKELSVRNLPAGPTCVFYHDLASKGHIYDAPHFVYAIQVVSHGDASATIRLTPEMQHGERLKKAVANGSVLLDSRRESLAWGQLAIALRIQQGDCIVLGPTADSRGLGEHFFHTKTQSGEIEPVLLLVRLSEANADDAFVRPLLSQSQQPSSLR